MSPNPMPGPPSPPTKQYILAGKARYHGSDISGAKITIEDQTHAGTRSLTSSGSDSNFAETLANVSDDWANSDEVLISITHDGRRAQKKITIDEVSNPGRDDLGTFPLQAHWGCCGY